MDAEFMRKVQRCGDAVWLLPVRTSITLPIGPGVRVLRVCEGRLWLTSSGTAKEASMDVWLVPGDSIELPAGLRVVMEAWPSARFQLLVPPQACRASSRTASALARALAWIASRIQHRAGSWLQPSSR